MRNLSKIIYQSIRISLKNLINHLKPECIILYGSFARGDYNERSDIDIIVISTNIPLNFYKRMQQLYELIDINEVIDILGYTPDEFKQMLEKRHCTSLFAMDEGIPLYGKKFFNELKKSYNQIIQKYQLIKKSSAWVPKFLD